MTTYGADRCRFVRAPRLRGTAAWLPTLVALAAGAIFVTFGVGHFADHGSEVADFRGYQVPFPSLAVWAVGVVELGGRGGVAPRALRPAGGGGPRR